MTHGVAALVIALNFSNLWTEVFFAIWQQIYIEQMDNLSPVVMPTTLSVLCVEWDFRPHVFKMYMNIYLNQNKWNVWIIILEKGEGRD